MTRMAGAGTRRLLTAALAATVVVATSAALVAQASAARGLTTGFADPIYASGDAATRDLWLNRTAEAGAGIVRLSVNWSATAPTRPADPTNPADPAYDFSRLDRAVSAANQRGLETVLTAFAAPTWAEGPNRPIDAPPGSWKPNAAEFGLFARALATRYGGAFPDPTLGGTLPRVRFYQAWNEPNLDQYITPQYEGGQSVGPVIFRSLLNGFYDAVKAVHPDNVVISGGTAPYGEQPGGNRTRPLSFIRSLFCLKGRKKLRPTACDALPKLDALAHHPINTSGGPNTSAIHPDDVSTPDLGEVKRILRAAERKRRVLPRGRRPLWVTEFWWNTNPPNPYRGVAPARQALWIEEALYLFWKQGAAVAINLQIRDSEYQTSDPLSTNQSGLYFVDGQAKPSATAFRFPFVTERLSPRRLLAWGKAPQGGVLQIQRQAGGTWRTVKSLRVAAGGIFQTRLKLRGKASFRAVIGTESSLVWAQR
ncbi:MAG: hypothetical protein ACXWEF_04795 [Solirubrobacterales bacterium]